MDLTRFYRMVRKSTLLLIALTLIGAAAGVTISFVAPARYASTERLFFSFAAPATSTPGDLVQANNFAMQKVFSYVEVVSTPAVLDTVIAELGLNTTSAELSRDVSATVPQNSVIIAISAAAGTPEEAATLTAAISSVFADYVVNTLEAPRGGGPGPVEPIVLQPALAPEHSSGPGAATIAVLGALAGLFIGLVACLILAARDRRVHTRRELDEVGVPYLAGIGEPTGSARARRAAHTGLAVRDRPTSAQAEAIRRIRTALLLGAGPAPRTIAVASSVGGEGASVVAADLALAYAESGASVAVLDADVRFGRQTALLGLEAVTVETAVARGADKGVTLVTLGAHPALPHADYAQALRALTATFDVVIVDAPPVLHTDDAAVVAAGADATLLVAASGRVDVAEVQAAVATLQAAGTGIEGAVLTRLPVSGIDSDPAVAVPARRGGGHADTSHHRMIPHHRTGHHRMIPHHRTLRRNHGHHTARTSGRQPPAALAGRVDRRSHRATGPSGTRPGRLG